LRQCTTLLSALSAAVGLACPSDLMGGMHAATSSPCVRCTTSSRADLQAGSSSCGAATRVSRFLQAGGVRLQRHTGDASLRLALACSSRLPCSRRLSGSGPEATMEPPARSAERGEPPARSAEKGEWAVVHHRNWSQQSAGCGCGCVSRFMRVCVRAHARECARARVCMPRVPASQLRVSAERCRSYWCAHD
jgi:hypothetical protein